MNGSWKSASYYGSIKDGFTDIAPFGTSVSKATQSKIDAKKKAIEDGSSTSSRGRYDQSGALKVKQGDKLSLGDILGMTWFVKGVIGSPKG